MHSISPNSTGDLKKKEAFKQYLDSKKSCTETSSTALWLMIALGWLIWANGWYIWALELYNRKLRWHSDATAEQSEDASEQSKGTTVHSIDTP